MPIPFNGKTVLDQNTAVLDAVDSQDKLVDDLFTVSLPIRVNLASVLAAYPSWDNALVVRKAHPYVIQFRTYNAELGPAFAATTDWIKIG